MITIKKILCPVDFFPASDAAVSYAAGLASNYDANLRLFHVISPVISSAYEYAPNMVELVQDMEKASAERMKTLEEKARKSGIAVQTEIRVGDVYDEIKREIGAVKPELLVMGTHGRRGFERWFMGSTTEKLMRHTPVPLVTINVTGEKTSAVPRFRRILVTTDFSAGTSEALSYAFSVAGENESRITLLHVLHDFSKDLSGSYRNPLVSGVQEQLEDFVPDEVRNWCEVVTRVESGTPYQVILRTIEDEKIDLLVMNIHGKGMFDRALIGSNAERVVRAATCPVMLIPPAKKRFKRKARPGGRAAA